MRAALVRHDEIVRSTIEGHGGRVFSPGGDGFGAAFSRAGDALAAARDAQAMLTGEPWPADAPIVVRMGLHTGEVDERDGNYFGPAVNRAARIMAAGHGGQVLVSLATAAVAGTAGLVDLGEQFLAGLAEPERVFQLGDGPFPALRSVGAVPSNLPPERTVFVGRERELGVVAGLLRSARVVTLTGVGGVGKTRLAIRVAAGMVDEFPGGVWLVELAPLVDAALVPSAVASAIGAPSSPGVELSEVVGRFLAHRRALVVLDNCEHVIDRAAGLVDRLLGVAPRVRALATSREPLGVPGESIWRVPSLSVDTPAGGVSDAVALFATRAVQVNRGFALDDTNRGMARDVCRRLDGIPLAIELAAARTTVLSVEQILAHLNERFRLLTRGGRTAVPRQQTLQGAIDWSYELLTPSERDLFDLLGVFAGDFDLPAVAAVSGLDEFEALDLLEQLTDKSMLEADPARDRSRLLETLRQYAWDRLVATGRLAAARAAHATYFAALAGEQAALMGVPGRQVDVLDRLDADYDNLRAALAYLIEEREAETAARMARRLIGLFNTRHPREGLGWFQQVIAIADALPATTRARLYADAAFTAMTAGNSDAQGQYAQRSIEIGGEDAPAMAHTQLAGWYLAHDDPERAVETARKAVAAAARTDDRSTQVMARYWLVYALGAVDAEPEMRSVIPQLIDLAETLGSPTLRAASYVVCGEALALLGRTREALAMFRTALADADRAGPRMAAGARLWCALEVDDPNEAAELLRQAIPIARNHLAGGSQLYSLVPTANYALETGNAAQAAQLVGAYQQHAGQYGGVTPQPGWVRRSQRLREQLANTLDPEILNEELERGARLNADQALDLAYDIVTHNKPDVTVTDAASPT
jgi:predicted ATPase